MADINDTASTPQTPGEQPAPQVAQTPPPPVGSAPGAAPTQSPATNHSHTAIYVTLGIVGVLAIIAIFWSAFAYFSPMGAWSPVPGVMSDYQYKRAERDVRNQIEDDINSDDAATGDDEPDTAMSEIPDANGNYITVDQAIQTARAKVGQDSVYGVEFDEVNGKAVYVVDLNSGTTLYEVIIDATTGDVLNTESAPYPGAHQ